MGDSLPGPTRGAAKNYAVMSVSEIARFPLPPIADDALLLLWRLSAMPEEALFVCRAWGVEPKRELGWGKLTGRGEHSAKRVEFYDIAERLFPGPRVELFARGVPRPGWEQYGREAWASPESP